MAISYRLSEDIELLSDMRMAYIRHDRPGMEEDELETVKKDVRDFIRQAQSEGRYLGFIGEIDGQRVCSAGLLVYDLPPLDSAGPRRVGHVLNFFTFKEHRRKGYGKGMMDFMIRAAKERGFDRLTLNATPDGYPLYVKCGFGESAYKALRLPLRG
jgi:GNAT superfamily N-acetyltransferase